MDQGSSARHRNFYSSTPRMDTRSTAHSCPPLRSPLKTPAHQALLASMSDKSHNCMGSASVPLFAPISEPEREENCKNYEREVLKDIRKLDYLLVCCPTTLVFTKHLNLLFFQPRGMFNTTLRGTGHLSKA